MTHNRLTIIQMRFYLQYNLTEENRFIISMTNSYTSLIEYQPVESNLFIISKKDLIL